MGAAALPVVAKVVVGFAVSKVVGELTGNQLLGALAGGIAGGGLGFQTGTGFTWSLNNIGGAAAGAANAGNELLSTMPGGTALFDTTAGNADLLAGTADLATGTVVDNVAGAAGGLGDLAGAVTTPDILSGESALGGVLGETGGTEINGGGFFNDLKNSLTPEGFESGMNQVNAKVSEFLGTGTGSPTGNLSQGLEVNQPPTQGATSRVVNTQAPTSGGGSSGVFQGVTDFMKDNPAAVLVGGTMLQSMFAPDPGDIAEDQANARYQAKGRFQNQGFGGGPTPPSPSLPSRWDQVDANSPLAGQRGSVDYTTKYANIPSVNYQNIIDSIRNRRPEEQR